MKVTVIPEYSSIPTSGEVELYLMLRVEIPQRDDGKRPPIHLALVLDNSLSMQGEKIERTKQACVHFVNFLTRFDSISIITFNSEVTVVVPFQPLTDKKSIQELIGAISTKGNTNLSGGWLQGISELKRNFKPDALNRLILLTDGGANEGVTDARQLVSIGTNAYNEKINTTTLGFGNDFQEALLKDIADNSGGSFSFIKDPESIADAFRKEFSDLVRLVGQNMELKVKLRWGISLVETLGGYPERVTPEAVECVIGDIYEGETFQYLFKIKIHESFIRNQKVISVGDVRLRYIDLTDGFKENEIVTPLEIRAGGNGNKPERNRDVLREVWLAAAAKLKEEAAKLLENGEFFKAVGLLTNHISTLTESDEIDARVFTEKNRLLKIIESITSGRADTNIMAKSLVDDAASYAKRKSDYSSAQGENTLRLVMRPEENEKIAEFSAELERVLLKYLFSSEKTNAAVQILRELLNNAIEHGSGPGKPDLVMVECTVAREFLRITVKDNGPGFDYEKIMKEIENKEPDMVSPRGRGLMLVRSLCDRLAFSQNGTVAEAVLMRRSAKIKTSLASTRTSEPNRFEIITTVHNIVVVTASGEIASYNCGEFKGIIHSLISQGWNKVIFDFSELGFIDSTGLGTLIAAHRKIIDAGGKMAVAGARENILSIFRVTGVDRIFSVKASVEEAVKELE